MFSPAGFGLLGKLALLILELLFATGGEGFGLAFETDEGAFETGESETPFGESTLEPSLVLDTLARVAGTIECWKFEAFLSIPGTSCFMAL